jgi:hypothetical protein
MLPLNPTKDQQSNGAGGAAKGFAPIQTNINVARQTVGRQAPAAALSVRTEIGLRQCAPFGLESYSVYANARVPSPDPGVAEQEAWLQRKVQS